jgi:hypothetical protein
VVEFAVVEEYVGIGVGGDGEGPLSDAGSDEGPGFALAVPEADAAVAEVMWRPSGCARGFAGARDRGAEPFLREVWEDRLIRVAVLAGREGGDDGGEEVGRE